MLKHTSLSILLAAATAQLLQAQVPTFEEDVLVAPAAQAGERLGDELSMNADWICAGLSERASASLDRAGVVLAWPRTAAGYGSPIELTSPDQESFGRFGTSVALDHSGGSSGLAIGENRSSQFGSPPSGVVHIYREQAGSWLVEASLPNPGFTTNLFGASVGFADDLVVVGAPNQNAVGAVYVYRNGGGGWFLEATLTPSDATGSDQFGGDVAVDGNRVIVGAIRHAIGGAFQGAAYVFEGTGGAWAETGKVTSATGTGDLGFGVSVALDRTTAVVGATQTNNVGAAYVYDLAGGSPALVERLQPSGLGSAATFGHSVAIRGDQLVVGAYQDTVVGTLTGSAWIFERTAGSFLPRQRLVRTGLPSFHGFSVALDGGGRFSVGQPVGSGPGGPSSSGSIGWYDQATTVGTNYCDAVPNSTGLRAGIAAIGSTAAAANDVELVAFGLPNQSFGFFITSQSEDFAAQPGGSDGNLCLGGAIGRYVGPGQVQTSGTIRTFSLALDLTSTPTPGGLVTVAAGESYSFQAWYRDSAQGQPTSNFTEGLTVAFD